MSLTTSGPLVTSGLLPHLSTLEGLSGAKGRGSLLAASSHCRRVGVGVLEGMPLLGPARAESAPRGGQPRNLTLHPRLFFKVT